ncbi:MAG TPA: ferredoxin:protochlorophyllide reductase (ATP-dependent) subunit B, partial [Prochlorococcaceae cyanobacterium Fu_MAG_134]|nr:ferredoxin:protochlorophyllide reductase (ATP-dependent) subunit B [Prochlorococcaceae cyanobacterium Fu_MAG_134]
QSEEQATQADRSTAQSGEALSTEESPLWTPEGEAELAKIPFFVRGKVRRNTEKYARQAGCRSIDSETVYDAKVHFRA